FQSRTILRSATRQLSSKQKSRSSGSRVRMSSEPSAPPKEQVDQAAPSERGKLIVVSAPSGAGKSSLAGRVLKRVEGLHFSVSYTTREARGSEPGGVSRDERARRISRERRSARQSLRDSREHSRRNALGRR